MASGGGAARGNTLQFNSSHSNLLDDTDDNEYLGNDNFEYQQQQQSFQQTLPAHVNRDILNQQMQVQQNNNNAGTLKASAPGFIQSDIERYTYNNQQQGKPFILLLTPSLQSATISSK